MARPSAFFRSWIPWAVLLGFALLVFLGDAFRAFEAQELSFLDLRFRLRGERSPHPDIVIVEINDESIHRIGHWPWPRSYHAALLKTLASYGPRVILYDVLFTEASLQPQDDELLAHAIHETGNTIASFFFHTEDPFLAFFPAKPFREAARYLGFVNISSDVDARVRRIQAAIHPKENESRGGFETRPYYHTSVMAFLATLPEEKREEALKKIPVDRENSFWINFPGRYFLFRRISFYQVIAPEEGEEQAAELKRLIHGKIVVVGHTATGGGDFRPTPFSPAYPGVGIQASAVHTLLTGEYLRRSGAWISFAILLVMTLLVTFLTWKNPPLTGLLSVLALAGFYLVWNFLFFRIGGWILPVFSVLVVVTGTYLLALFLQFIQVRVEGELVSRELTLAAKIQESFLSQSPPQIEGVQMGFQCLFARTVGGDLYDWVPLGQRRLGVSVGDVSGKGVPAALYMAKAISEFRSLVPSHDSPSALIEALNARLTSTESEGMFVTLLYLILDLDSKIISLCNAGHEPPYLYRHRTGKGEWLRKGGGPPLGLFAETRYSEEKIPMEEGDFMVLMSDGVKELRSPRGVEFGYEGMEKALDSFSGNSAEEIVKRLFLTMDEHSKKNPAHDDRTLFCLKIGGKI